MEKGTMKKVEIAIQVTTVLLLLVAVIFSFSIFLVDAEAQVKKIGCGIEPLPPIGCINAEAQCVCTDDSCFWIWLECD